MDIPSCLTWSLTMDLKTLDPTSLSDFHLPEEALAALAAGTEWEMTPDLDVVGAHGRVLSRHGLA